MKKYLWLDDIHDPNSSVWKYEYFPESDREKINVIWFKEYPELVDYINQFGLPDKIFFDHRQMMTIEFRGWLIFFSCYKYRAKNRNICNIYKKYETIKIFTRRR
jgi:hypothetical protein